MKTFILLTYLLFAGITLSAQELSSIPKIGQQITDYFSYNPCNKVFIQTDKTCYRPGETIWFRALVTDPNNQPASGEIKELFIKLYDKKGNLLLKDIFKLNNGSTPGDLCLPEDLQKGTYFLVAYTSGLNSTEGFTSIPLNINPSYSNQWVASTTAKDSIFISGRKNELLVTLRDVSGNIQKNTQLRYQFVNGNDVLEKGKLKTDEKGNVSIPLTIPTKTNGEPFLCVLSDNRDEWTHEVFLPTDIDPLVIRFFPEGGTLVTGTPAKVGFTAFNKWGIPVEVEGSVVNQENKSITTVKTLTKGLGLFSTVNEGKQKFRLILSGKTGRNQSFEIPAPDPKGLAFSVIKMDNEFISANLIFADKLKHSVEITVTQGTHFFWATDMEIDGTARIKIPSENIPQGINLVSVFSKEGKLLAERIIFQDKKQELNIKIQPEKNSLNPTENMTLKVRLADENNQPLSGSIVVSVSDKFRNGTNKQRIDEYLLLDSELETPFSLISGFYSDKISNSPLMDIFLISNRMKTFNWNKIRQFKPENGTDSNIRGNRIAGFVTDKNGNKINKAKVSLVNNKTMQIHTTTTNSDGIFSFPNLNRANADDFSAKATDPEGKRELKVAFNKNFEGQLSAYIAEKARKYCLLNADKGPDESYVETNPDLFVKAPKLVKANTSSLDNQRRLLSSSTNLLDVIKVLKPYKIMNNQIVFVGSENSFNYQSGALIVVDEQQLGTDVSTISNISPSEVDYINVSTNPIDIQRYTGLNSVGIIEIFMKKAKPPVEEVEQKGINNRYDGDFRIPNAFPTPPANPKRDMRTTLTWIPELQVNETGEYEFLITTSKVLSDFIIDVQGISENGRMGAAKVGFTVKK